MLAALVDLAETSHEAAHVLDETALYLGAGIADLINLFGPDQIILSGWAGLLLGRRLLPAIRSSAHEHALSHAFAETTITVGRIGPDAVARGAAMRADQPFPLSGRGRAYGLLAALRPGGSVLVRPSGPFD